HCTQIVTVTKELRVIDRQDRERLRPRSTLLTVEGRPPNRSRSRSDPSGGCAPPSPGCPTGPTAARRASRTKERLPRSSSAPPSSSTCPPTSAASPLPRWPAPRGPPRRSAPPAPPG